MIMEKRACLNSKLLIFFLSWFSFIFLTLNSQAPLKKTLKLPPDPCKCNHVGCSDESRITRIQNASALQNFSANSANISGSIPVSFGLDAFPGLTILHLPFNELEGEFPAAFSGSQIQSLWLNGPKNEGKLTDRVDSEQNMTFLKDICLLSNGCRTPLQDFSSLTDLQVLYVRDNSFTGPVRLYLVNLESLNVVNLTNNSFQGPIPVCKISASVDMAKDSDGFIFSSRRECDSRVNTSLLIVKSMGYPQRFAQSWKGNDLCADWIGITYSQENVIVVNFQKMGLMRTISPEFSSFMRLQRSALSGNNLTGSIRRELTTLPALKKLDVSNNQPSCKLVKAHGNPGIGKEISGSKSADTLSNSGSRSSGGSGNSSEKWSQEVVASTSSTQIGKFVLGILLIILVCLLLFFLYGRVQRPNAMVIRTYTSGSDSDSTRAIFGDSTVSVISETHPIPASGQGDIQMVEARNMVISIEVLRNATNNFSEGNRVGKGGFAVVYKGELHDGTKIAVKRMVSEDRTGLPGFKSEIDVLTMVRHRHLVVLLGYCLDGNKKLLVYEFMPQGTLSRHLFNWADEGLKPLKWTQRLIIALDVARGVEYLHCLALQSFIHRDLKPSNILLGDDMRAKVADFGLVRLAPGGNDSVETRIAGTLGYLAPEYAATGRATTKVDVFSFGIILIQLITGRKAVDNSRSENTDLATWFLKAYLHKDSFHNAVDPTIDLDEETLASIKVVAELAVHCSAVTPSQRPDMGHAVHVLSSLVERWKPTEGIQGVDTLSAST